jgi:hypothetical protein
MDGTTIIGIALIVWGLSTGLIAIFKPKALWKMGKIQGFVQILGATGTTILFFIAALIAVAVGIWVLTYQ